MSTLPRIIGSALLACAGTGCALKTTQPVTPPPPPAFAHASGDAAQWPAADWYRQFNSAELDTLIAAAADNNLDIAAARARVLQSDARARQAHAAILPSVDANGSVNYLAGHSSNGSANETDWAALLSASYEVDFWGKNRAASQSAQALGVAARADRDTLALTTLAGIATTYFEVLSLRERLALAHANVQAAGELAAVVEARFNGGLATAVELATQKAVLASARLVIPDLEQQQDAAVAALATLEGRTLNGFEVTAQGLDDIHEPNVAPGLPSQLLQRRPDIRTAEANLQSASADLVVARAALYPSLTLTAAGGVQNPALNAAVLSLAGTGPTLNLGAGLLEPIFNAGRLRAARAEAEARQQELAIGYRGAILAALTDVENALSEIQHLQSARPLQAENLAQSERAFEGAQLRYKAGSGDYLTVLEAQRTLYTARDAFSAYRLARLQALVGLCKALGGGWQSTESPAQQASRSDNPPRTGE